jgi:trehalose synthase
MITSLWRDSMSSVPVGEISLDRYLPVVGERKIREIRALAENLKGKNVCHVNSTSFGGGVAEILHRIVPLLRDVGLEAEWKVITGSDEFFQITKTIHNGLQGMNLSLTDYMKKAYLECNEETARELDLHHEFVVIHDNQPAATIIHYKLRANKWIWRCHVDLSNPNPEFIHFLTPIIFQYDALIFSMENYVQEPLRSKRIAIVPPSIDPLSEKNRFLSSDSVLSTLDRFGVDAERPIITQVSRFDPWKDPLGVIDTYRIVKKQIPSVQLLLVASMAKDDPEGWTYYEKTARHAGNDHDIHLLTNLNGVGDTEVNAFQRASKVVLQKSTREGFGLSVTEALWKEVPVVGGNVGGIPLQVINGENGFLVNSIEEAAERTLYLLRNPAEAAKMGKEGRNRVLNNFLITRHLEDYLRLFNSL